ESVCPDASAPEASPQLVTVCVQGLGFVGSANAIAIAGAKDRAGRPLYRVVGVDLPNDLGRARAAAVNAGRFPFANTDRDLEQAVQVVSRAGNFEAVTDEAAFGEADVIVVDVGLDIDDKGDRPTFKIAPFRAALEAIARHMRPETLVLLEST